MKRRMFFLSFLLLFIFLSNAIYAENLSYPSDKKIFFEGSEHIVAGNSVILLFSPNDVQKPGKTLKLPNGLVVTYGDIVSFGDFYELVGKPIAFGKTQSERKALFLEAYNTFAIDPKAVNEAKEILKILHSNKKIIDDAMHRGEDPEVVYKAIAGESNRQFNCITGGGCDPDTWWLNQGRYLKLAASDYDHFGEHAWISYQAGHEAAIDEALAGYKKNDINRLINAYAMNAFACHFLTDRFATGHMRSPRFELATQVIPSLVGSLLVHFMHDEENHYGLHVHNKNDMHWMAYGDKAYFTKKNGTSRVILENIMQLSANEIFQAFTEGRMPASFVYALMPIPDEVKDRAQIDVSPMFYVDEMKKTIMRRVDLANPYDRRWTEDWWGWSTLTLLANIYGLPVYAQNQLAESPYAEKALQQGLITNKYVVNKITAKLKNHS